LDGGVIAIDVKQGAVAGGKYNESPATMAALMAAIFVPLSVTPSQTTPLDTALMSAPGAPEMLVTSAFTLQYPVAVEAHGCASGTKSPVLSGVVADGICEIAVFCATDIAGISNAISSHLIIVRVL
jgi:hypothetical protein